MKLSVGVNNSLAKIGFFRVFSGSAACLFVFYLTSCSSSSISPLAANGSSSKPLITWTAPSAIAYGTALSATQLDATANIAGTFTYSPEAGSILTVGTHALTATFTPSDSTKYSTASSSVTLSVTQDALAITPSGQTLNPGQSVQFSAFRDGNTASGINWFVNGLANGSSSLGTITAEGLYTAPVLDSATTISISAVDSASKQSSNAVAMTINAPLVTITNDATTSSNAATFPLDFLGAGAGNFGGQLSSALLSMQEAGFRSIRMDATLDTIFANGASAPDWSAIDASLRPYAATSMHVLMIIDYTPSFLQPASNPCTTDGYDPSHALPVDMTAWASIVTQFVKHVDANFPGLIADYEVWNEPDGQQFLCLPSSSNSTAQRISSYVSLYATTARAIKTQLENDGASAKVGGPTLSGVSSTTEAWISTLLADPAAAPLVDFVSYHEYIFSSLKTAPSNWNSAATMISATLKGTTNRLSVASNFKKVKALVAAGQQPNASATPVYITEFNTTSGLNGNSGDCCRNDPSIAPVWNSLFVTSYLAAAADNGGVPDKIFYYAAHFASVNYCLLSDINTQMDCSSATSVQPFPQFYAYQLLGSENYLNLPGAGSVLTQVAVASSDISATAFVSGGTKSVIINNTASQDYGQVAVVWSESGASVQSATGYRLPSVSGQSIAAADVSLTHPTSDKYVTLIDVPAYSVQAVVFK